jgi:hypothetical protein
LRAVVLAARISQRVYSDTRVISITIITIYVMLAEKIGIPLIRRMMVMMMVMVETMVMTSMRRILRRPPAIRSTRDA